MIKFDRIFSLYDYTDLKNNNKPPLQRKAKLGDGSHIAAEDR